jgi:hypothetical protein
VLAEGGPHPLWCCAAPLRLTSIKSFAPARLKLTSGMASARIRFGARERSIAVAGGLITPDELRRLADEKEMEKAREALEKKRKVEDEQHHLRDAFMTRDIHPDVFERVSKVVRAAAERGEREVMVLRFPSSYCSDGGRAINNFESGWPDTLTGFARRAYEFGQKELTPQGYKVRAQIMDFPGGMPGDVGLFLRW